MKIFKQKMTAMFVSTWMILLISGSVFAHCQVPCGIYDDHARIHSILEDSVTVIKAAKQMALLAGKTDVQSANQMVRWVMNKEKHAQDVISTITDYFLTQRVKMSQKDYVQRLKDHHAVIVAAMKAKQNSDPAFGQALQESIRNLEKYYPDNQ